MLILPEAKFAYILQFTLDYYILFHKHTYKLFSNSKKHTQKHTRAFYCVEKTHEMCYFMFGGIHNENNSRKRNIDNRV